MMRIPSARAVPAPRPRGAAVRRSLRWLLLAGCAGLGACSWLEAEFSTLDRLPPAWQTPIDAPASATAEHP